MCHANTYGCDGMGPHISLHQGSESSGNDSQWKVIPSSVESDQDQKRDKNIEVLLPTQASIGLAGVVFLNFESTGLS
jgi:hypothetical protein